MVELTKENFEAEVEQAEGYIFIDFYGDGCVPCAALMPHVHALADKYADSKLKFCAMNTTKARRLAINRVLWVCGYGNLQRWQTGRSAG